jgi:hypothetical protein
MTESIVQKKMLSCILCHLPDNPNEPFSRKFVINHAYETDFTIYNAPPAGYPFAAVQLFPINEQS